MDSLNNQGNRAAALAHVKYMGFEESSLGVILVITLKATSQ